jgi:hypothetical protein
MSDNDIQKPEIKDERWLIFPHTIFSHLDSMDCSDAIEGICYKNKTFDQCLKLCDNDINCAYGYHIDFKNKDSICVPLANRLDTSNPIYRLRDQTIYRELEGAYVKTFMDKKVYQFPPEQANTVFYMDNFILENIETNMKISDTVLSYDNKNLVYSKDGNLQIQLLQIPHNLSESVQYIPVKYGDVLCFNIPTTNLVMIKSDTYSNRLEWASRSFYLDNDVSFIIKPLPNSRKKIGDTLSYSDTFTIHYNTYILSVHLDGTNHLEINKDENINKTFKFNPKMTGYYCDSDNKCKEISLEEMIIDDNNIGTYNGTAVGRNPGCSGVCSYKAKEYSSAYNKNYILIWILIIPTIIFVIFYLISFIVSK